MTFTAVILLAHEPEDEPLVDRYTDCKVSITQDGTVQVRRVSDYAVIQRYPVRTWVQAGTEYKEDVHDG